jgi:cell wall-associated NlpC family hydrolase
VFFYSPISHVGIYVGGGSMIHSPQTGSVVSVVPIYWDSFVGAARPG